MEWLPELFSGYEIIIIIMIGIGVVPIFLLIDRLSDGNKLITLVALVVSIIAGANLFFPLTSNYDSGIIKIYKDKLYEHYNEYEGYIEKVDDISVDDISEIYPYKLEPYTVGEIEKRVKNNSFIKLITVNMDGKISNILLWDKCAEYKEVVDDSIEESYYQLCKDDAKKIVVLEKHICTNEFKEWYKEIKKVPQS